MIEILEVIVFIGSVITVIAFVGIWTMRTQKSSPDEWSDEEKLSMYVIPRIAAFWFVLIIIFLVSNLNKFPLIFLLPISHFLFKYIMRKRFENASLDE